MKTRLLFLLLFLGLMATNQAQVSINQEGIDPHESAMLDVSSHEKGLLIPRMSSAQRVAIENPANGLMVFDTSTDSFWFYSNGTSQWEEMGGAIVNVLNDLLDAKTDANSIYIGNQTATNDDGDNFNTVVGFQALKENMGGSNNIAVGTMAMRDNSSGNQNTAIGTGALLNNENGNNNVAVGYAANGFSNSEGDDNVAIGNNALLMNGGNENTVIGKGAGQNSSGTASGNIFLGYEAGKQETGSNKLYIENSSSSSPLIGGNFDTDEVIINGEISVSENISAQGNLELEGFATIGHDLTVNQNTNIAEDLSVSQNANINGNLNVNDSLVVNNSITTNQTLRILGGNPGQGKVLTSDENGKASWQNASGGANELNDLSDAKTNGTSVYLGNLSGQNTDGIKNVTLGVGALWNTESSIGNVAIGYFAGYTSSLVQTHGNVIIGSEAGYGNEENNQLIIDNNGTSTPLIHGDFEQDHLKINGTLQITGGNPGQGKVLVSDANGKGSWQDVAGAQEINELTDGKSDNSSVYLGQFAGLNDEYGNHSNLGVGFSTLKQNTAGTANTALGFSSLFQNSSGNYNTAIGYNSAASNTTGSNNIALGRTALVANTIGNKNIAIGDGVLLSMIGGNENVAIGNSAIANNQNGEKNTVIGYEAGKNSTNNNMTGSVLIGYQAGYSESSDNKLYIENSSSNTPLIGGDFQEDFVDINGDLNINGTLKITGGTPGHGKVLTSDANGNASWETPSAGVSSIDDLSDAKNDGSSIFLGSTGGADDGSNKNTAAGKSALNANTSGQYNVAFGHSSLFANTTGTDNTSFGSNSMELSTTGNENTAIGSQALYLNGTGNYNTALGFQAGYGTASSNTSGNVFLGYKAGYYETGNNKLFIDNSDTYFPLIYGDFDLDKIEINGTLKIAGGNPGLNKILVSDYEGNSTWQDPFSVGVSCINDLNDGKTDNGSLFLGENSGINDDGNNFNTSIGNTSLNENISGIKNVAIGAFSLQKNTTGNQNVSIGYSALHNSTNSNNNIAIGNNAGYNSSSSNSIFIGSSAGFNSTQDNVLYIDNSSTEEPLIKGDFENDIVDINGSLYISGENSIIFSEPKTGYYSIHNSAFTTAEVPSPGEIRYGETYLRFNPGYSTPELFAPVNLPDNSKVTKFTVFASQEAGTSFRGYLYSRNPLTPYQIIEDLFYLNSGTDAQELHAYETEPSTIYTTIDSQYQYFIKIIYDDDNQYLPLKLYGVKIEYEYTKVTN